MRFSLFFLLFFAYYHGYSQSVVVSEYFNEGDTRDEWIELLIIQDQTSLIGFTLRDNNASQTSWQDSVIFANHNLWTNLRAGTIIVIWNRFISSSSSLNPIDTNGSDGYIEVNAQLSGIFTGGSFGSSPSWSGNTLSIAGSGELIQIRNASNAHVHALGHRATTGTNFNSLSSPKLNHASTSLSGESIRVNPGANLTDYNGVSGTTLTTKNSSLITLGLPNQSSSDTSSNLAFWRLLRQPNYAGPNLNAIIANGSFNQFSLTWNACADPYPMDSTIGYIILRNTSNTFSNPIDGFTYTVGQSIGSASVVGLVNYSQLAQFTDNTQLNCGQTFFYKIFAFRYKTDQSLGSAYHSSRGRAYNETGTNVQSISRPQPTPISSILAY
jgi:hypothetical protein